MDNIIDTMVSSVYGLQRVESCLFYEVEGVPVKTIDSMLLSDDCVQMVKSKVAKVIDANCTGPLRWVVPPVYLIKDEQCQVKTLPMQVSCLSNARIYRVQSDKPNAFNKPLLCSFTDIREVKSLPLLCSMWEYGQWFFSATVHPYCWVLTYTCSVIFWRHAKQILQE